MEPVSLYFTRRITKGLLKGLIHHDQIRCHSVEACVEWANAVKTPKLAKRNGWELIDMSFQKYAR